MKYINYESDFKIIESLKNNVPISSAPFKFIYYTRFFRNTLEASYDGKEYINCKPTEDGKLVVVFDNHHLGAGPLKVKRYFYLNDSDFKDGVCDLVSEESLDIYLDKDSATEGCEVDSKVSAYYHVIENSIIPEGPSELLVKVTYEELKNLRDNAQLVPGCSYRITNYKCVISNLIQEGPARTANHKFDIIVQATEPNRVSHNAFAAHNDNDPYFSKSKLEAWRLWYDLDNDTTKYFWANKTEGKGVIYRMVDEYNNDLPYDFKNIVFVRDGSYVYTFNRKSNSNYGEYNDDATVYGFKIYNNKFESGAWNNVFLTYGSINNNKFGPDCKGNTFNGSTEYNTINSRFTNNNILNDFTGNVIGSYVDSNHFRYFDYNTLGNGILGETFYNISNTNINNRNSITKGIDYYDDGNNKLVPIKHPDLATQPNILPYKFAGNYVYEQMVWVEGDKLTIESDTIDLIKFSDYNLPLNPSIILDYNIFTVGDSYLGNCSPIYSIYNFSFNIISNNEKIFLQRGSGKIDCKGVWIRLVWSYLTKQGGEYYYYNAENKDDDNPSKYNLYINVEDGYTWEINGKQHNTGLHKLDNEEVEKFIKGTSHLYINTPGDNMNSNPYLKAKCENFDETRNYALIWEYYMNNIYRSEIIYDLSNSTSQYSLMYHLPMAAEAIKNGEKVVLELTDSY